MKQKMSHQFGLRLRRVLSGVLCAVMLCGLLPEGISLSGSAQAAEAPLHWSSADLQTLNDYGIMRGNENGDMMPDKSVTRAEFVAMINRSLGYNEKAASSPFKDVASADWFSDDISISYNMGYFSGTSKNTASPYVTLTREQALVALGRNLMLQPTVGESFSYADTRSFGSWSRGYIDPAVEAGIIDANRTGDFNPQKIITRGELAGMVVRTLGTRISTSGLRNLGTVDGNVTITTSNVTLRNTTINGDLYLTGGIGLGDVHLDNVTVRGKIVDAGAGLSEKGDISVILNNVTAEELVVDSMRNQTVSLRTSGTTSIPKTSVRTSAYLDDSTSAGYGLRLIEVDGEEKTAVTLSGNIKEVHNKTPKSSLNIGEGVADKVTVDEAATGSTVTIGKDARVKELNLDAGIKVDGSGSIDKVSISANGATVAQLPDEIVIAPGITATVNKQKMDTAAAVEASSRPRLASGYPYVPENNINPTGATALFMTNKPGTIYWALTAKASGSPSEEDIISPPSYAKYILKYGKIQAKESNKEYTAKISGLTSDGSYYLSAILVDDRGSRSTMKVTAFDTPDNTTPAFSSGYPTVTASEKDAQLSAMTTKNCYLYYTVLPKGSTAPRGIDFQTGSITGNLGYGVVRMAKNSPTYIYVNDVSLEEKQPYVLYLWLTDFDGAKSSAVKAVNFTTQDRTDPIVTNLRQTKATTTSVTAAYALNEPGTLYWAVVKSGDKSYTTPAPGYTNSDWLTSRAAMERIVAGTGALKSGKSSVAASKAGADVSFTVSGLNSKTTGTSSYDLYYVGVDAAGNWSKPIRYVTIYTDDKSNPTVTQKFTSYNIDDPKKEDTTNPLADTNIKLVFSKQVGATDVTGDGAFRAFLDLYQGNQTDKQTLVRMLRYYIKLYEVPTSGSSTDQLVSERTDQTPANADWVIDYRYATVYLDGSNMVVEFPNGRALNLANGRTYYFSFKTGDSNIVIKDTTPTNNGLSTQELPKFTTKQAQVIISEPTVPQIVLEDNTTLNADFVFELNPKTTERSPSDIYYDIMLWCDASLTCDLYKLNEQTGYWERVTEKDKIDPKSGNKIGAFSYSAAIGKDQYQTIMGAKKNVGDISSYDYDAANLELQKFTKSAKYAVNIVTVGGSWNRSKWNLRAHSFSVTIPAANAQGQLQVLANNGKDQWADLQKEGYVSSIGVEDPYTKKIPISSTTAPELVGAAPIFDVMDTSTYMSIQLDQQDSIIYYIVALLNTRDQNGNELPPEKFTSPQVSAIFADPNDNFKTVPSGGSDVGTDSYGERQEVRLTAPDVQTLKVTQPDNIPQKLIAGQAPYSKVGSSVEIFLDDLQPDSYYGVYMMFEKGREISPQAVCYKFKTDPAYTPTLSLSTRGRYDATVDATITKTNAKVTSMLLFTRDVQGTVLDMEFAGLSGNYSGYNGMKVLDALCQPISSTDPTSIFDYVTLKNMTAVVVPGTGGGTGKTGNQLRTDVNSLIDTNSNLKWSDTINLNRDGQIGSKNMSFGLDNDDRDNSYICLARAENTADSTKRSFAAITGVQIVDTNPTSASSATAMLYPSEDKDDPTFLTVEGQITVTYENDLYLRDKNNVPKQFTTCDNLTDTTWFGVNDVPGFGSDSLKILTDGTTTPKLTDQIKIQVVIPVGKLSEVPKGWTNTISLPRFCNRNGFGADDQGVQITYKGGGSWDCKIVNLK